MYFALHNRNRSASRMRWAVLLCLVICQFPLPTAHSHHRQDHADSWSLAKHLRTHHASQQLDADLIHWHFVSPWDVACGLGDESDAVTPPLVSSGSGDGQVTPLDLEESIVTPIPASFVGACNAMPSTPRTGASPLGYCSGFLQSFLNVRPSQLTCVFLS